MNYFKQILAHDCQLGLSRVRDRVFSFAKESNKIEGITRQGANSDHASRLEKFLSIDKLETADLLTFNTAGILRHQPGMNVHVGLYMPPLGGQHIVYKLDDIIARVNTKANPYSLHVEFEDLHPFTDGNGRTGRALWLWQMVNQHRYLINLGFLHKFYYQTLENSR